MNVLKQEGDYDRIRKIYRNISCHPFVKSAFFSNTKPKDYGDIRRLKSLPYSGNFIGEATFYLLAFEQNKDILSSFIALKEPFDCKILLGDYQSAALVWDR